MTTKYGPKGNRIVVSGSEAFPRSFPEGGAVDLRVIVQEGTVNDLPEFMLGIGLILVS